MLFRSQYASGRLLFILRTTLVLLAHVFDHVATSNRALLAFISTAFHMLVVRELSAGFAALIARFRTCLAHCRRQCTVSRGDVRRDRTDVAAIGTQLHCLDMIFFAGGHQVFTVVMAGMAFQLTVPARLRTGVEVAALCIMRYSFKGRLLRAF